jgi:hypothetical protein
MPTTRTVSDETTYKVRGTTYRLKLDSDAMIAMEAQASTPERPVFFHQVMELAKAGSWTHQRILVWASLQLHHPGITLKQAGDIMLESAAADMAASIRALAVAASPAQPDLDTLGVKPPNPPAAQARPRRRTKGGTGTPSMPTRDASV